MLAAKIASVPAGWVQGKSDAKKSKVYGKIGKQIILL